MVEQNKTERIRNYLLQMIENNQLSPDGRLPTEKMLCEMFGVSRVPVQSAFNQLEKVVNIQRIKGQGSFVLSDKSADAAGSVSDFIPFVLTENNSSARFWEAVRGAETYLRKHHQYLTVRYAQNTMQSEIEVVDSLLKDGMRSILVLSRCRTPESALYYNRLISEGVNFVFVDNVYRGVLGDLVSSDNTLGGYMATRHLIQNGYKRPAFVTVQKNVYGSLEDRIIGYHIAMEEAAFPFEQHQVFYLKEMDFAQPGDDVNAVTEKFVQWLLEMKNPPDALFCENDYMALTVYRYLKKYNIRIPQEMALLGYDNLAEMGNMDIPITSVEQPFYSMGYQAARICLHKKTHPTKERRHILLPVSLFPRQSTLLRTDETLEQMPAESEEMV